MKIDFMLKDLTTSNNGLNLKMSNIEKDRLESKKFHQHILRIFKMIMQKGNRELEESIQHISNQNSIETRLMLNQLLRRFERGLDNLEIKEDEVDFATFNDELKEIVADEVNSFYTKIDKSKELIEEKNKIIRLIQKRYGEHVFSLKRSLEDKNKETTALNTQLKDLNQWLDDINEKYETKKIRSLEVEEQFSKIRKEKDVLEKNMLQVSDITNKSINLDKYKNEIKRLKKEVSRLNGKTEQLHELKESISLSSKTADSLVSLEKNYEDKIGLIEDRFKKIKHNPKNEKRLRKIFDKIIIFEKRLDDIKRRGDIYPIKVDPKITLHLLESDLEKIDQIIKKRQSKIYNYYRITRNIIIGVIVTSLLLYEPFWELCKQLLAF
jgi:chromosome segregation ATPase